MDDKFAAKMIRLSYCKGGFSKNLPNENQVVNFVRNAEVASICPANQFAEYILNRFMPIISDTLLTQIVRNCNLC